MVSPLLRYMKLLGVHIGLELPVVWLTARGEVTARRVAVAVIAANLVTMPVIHFVIMPRVRYPTYPLVAGIFSVCAEWLLYLALLRPLPWPACLAASVLANGVSFAIGSIVAALLV